MQSHSRISTSRPIGNSPERSCKRYPHGCLGIARAGSAPKVRVPGEPVQIQLNLKHSDGTSSTLSVVSDAGRKHHLVFINQGAPAYRTWFGMLKAPAATRPLADYELEALQRILGSR